MDAIFTYILNKKFTPYTLTDAGKKFLEISGGKVCIDVNFRDKYFEIHPELLPDGLQRELVTAI